jgi:membrane protein
VTSLLFTLGKFLIGLYLGRTSAGSAYGAAGSLVILLLWVYYSAQILFLGAEFTQVYARHFGARIGGRIEPARGAILVSEETRAQEGIPHRAGGEGQASGAAGRPSGRAYAPVRPTEASPSGQAGAPPSPATRGAPTRSHVFAASSDAPGQPNRGAKSIAATAAAAVLVAVVAATRLQRRH